MKKTLFFAVCIALSSGIFATAKYDTIAHKILETELAMVQRDPDLSILDKVIFESVEEIKELDLLEDKDPETIFKVIDRVLIRNNFIYRKNDLFADALTPKKIDHLIISMQRLVIKDHANYRLDELFYESDCATNSYIFVAVGEVLNLPIKAVIAPEHVLVVWEELDNKVYFETTEGEIKPLHYYIDWLNIHSLSIENDVFMRSLTNDELLGLSYYNSGLILQQEGDTHTSEQAYRTSLELFPKNPQALYHLSKILIDKQNFIEARDLLDIAIEMNPTSTHVINSMGLIHLFKKEYNLAKEYYQISLEINDESNPIAHLNLAIAEIEFGEYESAITHIKIAISTSRLKGPNIYYYLGIAYEGIKQYKNAAQEFSKMFELNKKFATIPFKRGNNLLKQNVYKGALIYFETAFNLNQNDYYSSNNVAFLYATIKELLDPLKALTWAKKTIELRRIPHTLGTLAYAFASNEMFLEAKEIATEAYNMSIMKKDKEKFLKLIEALSSKENYTKYLKILK